MVAAGTLIEYMDNGQFVCALVTACEDKRLRLVNQNGRETLLPKARVMHGSRQPMGENGGREQIEALLRATDERRRQLLNKVNLSDIWELAIEDGAAHYDPDFLAELTLGQPADDDILAAFLRAVIFDKTYFRYREGQILVQSDEQVKEALAQHEKERRKTELMTQGAAILRAIMAGENTAPELEVLRRESLEILAALYLDTASPAQAEIGRLLLKEAGLNQPRAPFDILVAAGVWSKHENIPLLKSGLPLTFSHRARQQAETLLRQPLDALFDDPGRKDFTHLRPMTIDGHGTLDFDDALTIESVSEGWLAGVHISDVAHYVQPGAPLFEEALARGSSLYFPEGQVPMLPRHLSQGICSLIQGEIRAAVSFMILLSPEAEVLSTRITPSIIKVARRLTYDEADSRMEDDPELKVLNDLRLKLRKRRLAQGALLLPIPDVNICIDQAGKPHISLGRTDTPARTLVSEMMILANSEAARHISDRMAPGLFRSQPPLKNRIVFGEDDDLFLNIRQRKLLPRGELLTKAMPHSGLGVSHYTTVTSPIRRLLDLLMQHQLNTIIRRQPTRFSASDCRDFADIINHTLAAGNAVKQQRQRYWLLRYLEDHLGQPLTALIIDAGPKRTNLLVADLLMDTELPTPPAWQPTPGATVTICARRADALENTVKFDWC
ncbi:MAG: RNB domain-containing ribonuclease [Desulfobulbaceae bacterium]|jgi:exoribonuclease-2|nr:RNB domain-containing ribonuclease [Desulfobulbaceae bacterium]